MTDSTVVPPVDDQDYEEYVIYEVFDFSEREGYYGVAYNEEWAIIVRTHYGDRPHGIVPRVGDTIRIYWVDTNGRRSQRGVLINGQLVYYQSLEEFRTRQEQQAQEAYRSMQWEQWKDRLN